MPGKKPASATPSRKRSAYQLCGPVTNAVAAEMMPQLIMIRAIQRLAPNRYSAMLLGISKKL